MKPCTNPACATGRPARVRGLCDTCRKRVARAIPLDTPLRAGDLTASLPEVRVPPWLAEMVTSAAQRRGQSYAEWMRRAVISAVATDVDLEG